MTFPFVITATALDRTLSMLAGAGVGYPAVLHALVAIEIALACAMVGYVFVRYMMEFARIGRAAWPPNDAAPANSPPNSSKRAALPPNGKRRDERPRNENPPHSNLSVRPDALMCRAAFVLRIVAKHRTVRGITHLAHGGLSRRTRFRCGRRRPT